MSAPKYKVGEGIEYTEGDEAVFAEVLAVDQRSGKTWYKVINHLDETVFITEDQCV